ncbi:hypothetical protein D3C85_1654860 [compost metagenome]
MSNIESDLALSLTATRGKRKPFTVKRMVETVSKPAQVSAPYPADQFTQQLEKMRGSIASGKSTADKIVAYCLTIGTLTAEQEAAIRAPIAAPTPEPEEIF